MTARWPAWKPIETAPNNIPIILAWDEGYDEYDWVCGAGLLEDAADIHMSEQGPKWWMEGPPEPNFPSSLTSALTEEKIDNFKGMNRIDFCLLNRIDIENVLWALDDEEKKRLKILWRLYPTLIKRRGWFDWTAMYSITSEGHDVVAYLKAHPPIEWIER